MQQVTWCGEGAMHGVMKELKKKKAKKEKEPDLLKIDLGCGTNPQPGFLGADIIKTKQAEWIVDLRKRWPWKDNSVDEAVSSHFLEHLTGPERAHFANELYRVLKPGAKAT